MSPHFLAFDEEAFGEAKLQPQSKVWMQQCQKHFNVKLRAEMD
jgi:hypothetical protein